MMEKLTYPYDVKYILRKRKLIKRQILEKKKEFTELKIAILGGSTTSEVTHILDIFLLDQGIRATFFQSEFNKYFEDSVFDNEELDFFSPDIIYIHITNKNINHFPEVSDEEDDVKRKLVLEIDKLKYIWSSLQKKFDCPIIQNNFEFLNFRELGNYDAYHIAGKNHFITSLNQLMAREARGRSFLSINDIFYLSSQLGLDKWFSDSLWFTSKYAMSFEVIPVLAKNISAVICSLLSKNHKCLVLDFDNTLWGGIIGEDGPEGILLGDENPVGEAHNHFQKYIKSLKGRGVILAGCSKNDYDKAMEGLEHKDCLLRIEDFTQIQANWKPKNNNIEQIAKDINIATNSLVFVDDSAVERELVKSQLRNISVPNIGDNITDYLHHIDKNYYFEPTSISKDDLQRSQFYKENVKRSELLDKFTSYDDFLKSLEMRAEVALFSEMYIERITQLVNKTNQFNLTSKRYTKSEVEKMFTEPKYIALYGRLIDKFGDNGLVSVVVGEVDGNVLKINLWLMSCRVLKRSFEKTMFDELYAICTERGITKIIGEYIKSQKNHMVSKFYSSLGFIKKEDTENGSLWELEPHGENIKNELITPIR